MPHPVVRRVGQTTGWISLALLIIVILLSVWQPSASPAIAVTAVAPVALFVAWPIAALGLIRRQWALGGVALVVIGLQLLLYLSTWAPWSTSAPAVGAWRMSLFDMNVKYNNANLSGVAAQIERERPDLVTLEELSPINYESLLQTGALDRYPSHFTSMPGGSLGFGVWSTERLTDIRIWQTPSHPQVEATITPADGAPIRLIVLHTLAPRGAGEPAAWALEMGAIAAKLRSSPQPLLVVGDFNATQNMREFRNVLRVGVSDAAVANGKGWAMTWPTGIAGLPAFSRLDHVLVSPGLTTKHYRLGSSSGSDHRPVLLTVARSA